MFKGLERKLKIYTFLLIFCILASLLFSIYISFENLVYKDYQKKSESYEQQISQNINFELIKTQQLVDIILSQNDFEQRIKNSIYDTNLSREIIYAISVNVNIRGFFVCSENEISYYSFQTTETIDFQDLIYESNLPDRLKYKDSIWYIIPRDYSVQSKNTSTIMYAKKLKSEGQKDTYFVVCFYNDWLSALLKQSSDFWGQISVCLISEKAYVPLAQNGPKFLPNIKNELNLSETSFTVNKKKHISLYTPMENCDFGIYISQKLNYFMRTTFILKLCFIITFVFVNALNYFVLKRLIQAIIEPLNALYHNMNDYL